MRIGESMSFNDIWQKFLLLLGMASVGYLTFQMVKSIFPDTELLAAQQRLGVESAVRQYRHWSLKMLSPFYRLLVPRIQQIKMPLYRQEKKSLFIAAGLSDQFDPDEFVGLKVASMIVFFILAWLMLVQFGYSMGFFKAVILLAIGFFLPDFVVWDTKNKRQKSVFRQLPSVLDLLTLSVEAGLDFIAAISRVIYFAKDGPLKDEFNQMLKELQLGTVRADALRNMADRVQLPALSSFATILIQADQMGGSIGPVLRAQSDQLRNSRFQIAEREGAKATQKLLIPLVFCILPSVFIVILGPVICDIFYNQSWFKDFLGGK
ncbi:MAG: Secretion system protein [Bacteriovoracaceae bacterium]|nr:Secretion system protein [Bacteriovoracaceae bacterium]